MISTTDHKPRWWQRKQEAVARGVVLKDELCIARAEGSRLWGVDGREYIDFASGIGVHNLGHRHPRVQRAIASQLDQLTHSCFHVAASEPYIALAERLNECVPVNGRAKSVLLSGGAEANENAVKLARAFTGREAVVALQGGFHGRTFMALAMTAKERPHKVGFGRMPGPVYHLPFPSGDGSASIDALDALLAELGAARRPAAIMLEPVQGEGGIRALPAAFIHAVRERCDHYEIVLIADEIQSGLGRSGEFFAMQAYGVRADITTLGKSLGGGLPLSAVVGRADIMDCVAPGALGNTFGGNPVACAAALAVLDEIESSRLWRRARQIGEYCRRALAHWPLADDIDVRVHGAMVGLAFNGGEGVNEGGELVSALIQRARRAGVVALAAGPRGEVLRLLPALTISDALLREGLERLSLCLRELLASPEHPLSDVI